MKAAVNGIDPIAPRLRVDTRSLAARAGDWDAMIRNLDTVCGIYCASLHGVQGLHPRFAWAINEVALRLEVFANSIRVFAVSPNGLSILSNDALTRLIEPLDRGSGLARFDSFPGEGESLSRRHPVHRWLRAFLAAFDAREPFGFFGTLKFEAHKLSGPWMPDDRSLLGVLLIPESVLIQESDAPARLLRFVYPKPAKASSPDPQVPLPPSERNLERSRTGAEDDHPPGGYSSAVARGLEALANQSLISLTLSQCFRRPWTGSAAQAFERLRTANPAPVTFLAHLLPGEHLFGASPDLQLIVRDRRVHSFPVCGTVRRMPGPIGQAQALKSLVNEAVDEASLAICSDALKNDLAPFCEPESVRLIARREPLYLATVVHAVDALEGELLPGCDGLDLVLATTAPAMVTGTPRSLALASIEQLEVSARQWYGGLVIRIGVGGDAEAGTILRAAWLHDGIAEVRTGGDLVSGSDPVREEEETRLKAISLWRALGLEQQAGVSIQANTLAMETLERFAHRSDRSSRLRANRLTWHVCEDPFEQSLGDLLCAADLSAAADDKEVLILSGTAPALLEQIRGEAAGLPTLAIGQAATWLLERECEALRTLPDIENGSIGNCSRGGLSSPLAWCSISTRHKSSRTITWLSTLTRWPGSTQS